MNTTLLLTLAYGAHIISLMSQAQRNDNSMTIFIYLTLYYYSGKLMFVVNILYTTNMIFFICS